MHCLQAYARRTECGIEPSLDYSTDVQRIANKLQYTYVWTVLSG